MASSFSKNPFLFNSSPKKQKCNSLNLTTDPLRSYFFNNSTPSPVKEANQNAKNLSNFSNGKTEELHQRDADYCIKHDWGKK